MKAKSKNIVLLTLLALIIGLFVGGYAQRLPFSMAGTEQRIVVPLDGSKHIIYGKQISSDTTKGLFFINNEPIYNGETKNGVWLAHQKSTAGLFILPITSALSLTAEGDIDPPTRVWADPAAPKAGESVYYHAQGSWDEDTEFAYTSTSSEYNALTYGLTRGGSQIDYGSTVTRMRSGSYDTSTSGAAGNKDAIESIDTIYRQFKGTLSSGTYILLLSEWYSGIGSNGRSTTFSVSEPIQIDTTPPIVSSFTVDKSSFAATDPVAFRAKVSDDQTGVLKVYIIWYNNGVRTSTMQGAGTYETSGLEGIQFSCGLPSTVTLVAEDGKGNVNRENTVSVTLNCIKTPEPVLVWYQDVGVCKQKSVSSSEAGAYYKTREVCESKLPKPTTTPPPTTPPLTTTPPSDKVTVYKISGDTCIKLEVEKSAVGSNYLSQESCLAALKVKDSKIDNSNNLNKIKDESPFMFLVGFVGTLGVGGLIGKRMKLL